MNPEQLKRQRPFLAVYCVVRRNDELLLMQRQNTGYADGMWSVPAGHVDVGESVTVAASRELREETGLMIPPNAWKLGATMHRTTSDRECIDLFFLSTVVSGIPVNREPEKCADLAFYPSNDLPSPFLDYVGMALRAMRQMQWREPVFLEVGWTG